MKEYIGLDRGGRSLAEQLSVVKTATLSPLILLTSRILAYVVGWTTVWQLTPTHPVSYSINEYIAIDIVHGLPPLFSFGPWKMRRVIGI